MYIVGLALCTLANISSTAMALDLCSEVEKLLGNSNAYIRKKAALCAIRIIRKVPDLCDNFVSKSKNMLLDKSHGILLSAVCLIHEICQCLPTALLEYRRLVPTLLKHLKSLLTSGFSPEHDVSGITDPFLQVKILQLLRVLGKKSLEASDQMNDVLAQVASNTDPSKNVGNAILYETVQTILEIESDSSLKVMAINLLGRFLSNKDSNIRYVALNSLLKCTEIDFNSVLRHRVIIVECLHDPDISIRRRALDLTFALINEQNVAVVVRDLMEFLKIAELEFYAPIVSQIGYAADKYSPTPRWHLETVLEVLYLAGNHAKEAFIADFLNKVAFTMEIHHFAAWKCFSMLSEELVHQEGLVQAGVWIIGEYGHYLAQEGSFDGETLVAVPDSQIIELLTHLMAQSSLSSTTLGYILTSLIKLAKTARSSITSIQKALGKYSCSMDLELQQRSTEYLELLSHSQLLSKVVAPAAVPPLSAGRLPAKSQKSPPKKQAASVHGNSIEKDSSYHSLVDLLGDLSVAPVKAVLKSKIVYSKNGLKIELSLVEDGEAALIKAAFENIGNDTISSILYQCAVPKSLALTMMPPTSDTLSPGQAATQMLQIRNPTKVD